MNKAALTVSNVSFKIRKRVILDTIHFSVPEGCVFAVVGHNGAGKTTLFHIILGLKFQSSGEVLMLGESNLKYQARSKLGYVSERPYIHLEVSLESFLLFHAKLMGISSSQCKKEVSRVAMEVGLEKHLEHSLSTFSKGMLQKTLLAQAALGDPKILILDEPMSGLDPEARESVRQRIVNWKNQGKTIIFSSHALEDVEQLSDEVLILREGKIEFLGSVQAWREKK